MGFFTHRHYFRRYQLNVAQYGEILIADAFQGRKLGDGQRGYDIVTSKGAFIDVLRRAGIGAETTPATTLGEEIRIQVKSKLHETTTGKANVVHCKDTDLNAMTHLAIILVHPGSRVSSGDSTHEGLILHAWLLTRDKAAILRQKPGKEQYIRVNQVKDAVNLNGDLFDIRPMLSSIADARIELAPY